MITANPLMATLLECPNCEKEITCNQLFSRGIICNCKFNLTDTLDTLFPFSTYMFIDRHSKQILYVGVTENLRHRLSQHRTADGKLTECKALGHKVKICVSMILPELTIYRWFRPPLNKVTPGHVYSSQTRIFIDGKLTPVPHRIGRKGIYQIDLALNDYSSPHHKTHKGHITTDTSGTLFYNATYGGMSDLLEPEYIRAICYAHKCLKCTCRVPCHLKYFLIAYQKLISISVPQSTLHLLARSANVNGKLISCYSTHKFQNLTACPPLGCKSCNERPGSTCKTCLMVMNLRPQINTDATDDEIAAARRKCNGKNAKGLSCGRRPCNGKLYCHWHGGKDE